jgi:hypothetical protein
MGATVIESPDFTMVNRGCSHYHRDNKKPHSLVPRIVRIHAGIVIGDISSWLHATDNPPSTVW